jgi:hypothetical protein
MLRAVNNRYWTLQRLAKLLSHIADEILVKVHVKRSALRDNKAIIVSRRSRYLSATLRCGRDVVLVCGCGLDCIDDDF